MYRVGDFSQPTLVLSSAFRRAASALYFLFCAVVSSRERMSLYVSRLQGSAAGERSDGVVKESEMASDTEASRAPEAPASDESTTAAGVGTVAADPSGVEGASRTATDAAASGENREPAVQEEKLSAVSPGENRDLNEGETSMGKTSSSVTEKEGEKDVQMECGNTPGQEEGGPPSAS